MVRADMGLHGRRLAWASLVAVMVATCSCSAAMAGQQSPVSDDQQRSPLSDADFSALLTDLRSKGFFSAAMVVRYLARPYLSRGVTLLLPTDASLLASIPPTDYSSLLRFHVLRQNLDFEQLRLFPVGTWLPTSLAKFGVQVTSDTTSNFSLNGVQLVSPNLCPSLLPSFVSCQGMSAILHPNFQLSPPTASPSSSLRPTASSSSAPAASSSSSASAISIPPSAAPTVSPAPLLSTSPSPSTSTSTSRYLAPSPSTRAPASLTSPSPSAPHASGPSSVVLLQPPSPSPSTQSAPNSLVPPAPPATARVPAHQSVVEPRISAPAAAPPSAGSYTPAPSNTSPLDVPTHPSTSFIPAPPPSEAYKLFALPSTLLGVLLVLGLQAAFS